MKHIDFEMVAPDELRPGDLVFCYCHDDQLEQRTARVERVIGPTRPGRFTWPSGHYADYLYRLWLICRHVNLRHLDAQGGPTFLWHRFNWNTVGRIIPPKREGGAA